MNRIDVSVNGQWLSEAVPGLVVTDIADRELHPRSIRDETIKGIDGSTFIGSEYPDRDLTVRFFIRARNNEERGAKYNDLASLLNFENGKIIFSDELDKYFVATPTKSGATEITFHCNDPFKYSVTERELKSSEGKFSFTNNGSVSCPIRYEFKTDADLGYIAIASKSGAMEYGDPKELDKEETTGPEKVLSWSQFLESPDGGSHPRHPSSNPNMDYVFNRKTKIFEAGPDKPWADGSYTKKKWLDLGEGTDSGNWISGALKTAVIKADANGIVGAEDWNCTFRSWFQTFNWYEAGEQSVTLMTADDQIICRIVLFKDYRNTHFTVELCMKDGLTVKSFDYTVTADHPFSQGNQGLVAIAKVDDRVNFNFDGKNYTFSDPDLKTMVCTKVQAEIAKNVNAERYMTRNYITDLSFTKRNVTGLIDIANTFPAGSFIVIDGSVGRIFVDGAVRNDLELLGSTYFKSEPGLNEIEVGLSAWFAGSKTMKAYIREAWV